MSTELAPARPGTARAFAIPHGMLAAAAWMLGFALLFHQTALGLAREWWTNPDAGHGLLALPVGLWFARRAGAHPRAAPHAPLGILVLTAAVVLHGAAALAAEVYTMRLAMLLAAAGLVVFHRGPRQLVAWWLPFVLLLLSIPLPELVLSALALPLQLEASRLGATMLAARYVPVELAGNIIRVPGHALFVTEACSGLRSLAALLALALVIGALVVRRPASRVLLVVAAIPIAVLLNGVRIFATGFLVHFVSPDAGSGWFHATGGGIIFLAALLLLLALGFGARGAERRLAARATARAR